MEIRRGTTVRVLTWLVALAVVVGTGPGAAIAASPSDDTRSATVPAQRCSRPADITRRIEQLPHVTSVVALGSATACTRDYAIRIRQPADHARPRGQQFNQLLLLRHRGIQRPVVLATGGYGLRSTWYRETAQMLDANQLSFEHRFFGASRPERPNWRTQLTIEQAARDQHRIIRSFKRLYSRAWLSTGESKGGMTVTYHRRFFPHDVDGTVAYVAPHDVDNAEDSAYERFLDTVGTASCRRRLVAMQRRLLGPDRAAMRASLRRAGTYHRVGGVEVALEMLVVDLPFQIWQYVGNCSSLPGPDAPEPRWRRFRDTWASAAGSNDAALAYFQPYSFQAVTQLGSPRPHLTPVADLLRHAEKITTRRLLPAGLRNAPHDATAMPAVDRYVRTRAERILFIYGGNDPWSAEPFNCGTERVTARQCRVMTVPGGTHASNIADLPRSQRQAARRLVRQWARP